MTRKELELIINGLNENMRRYCSFEDSESNDCLERGWFNEKDIIDLGIEIQEPIDEEKLDELALTEYNEEWAIGVPKDEYLLSHETNLQIKAFKAGYRKAMGGIRQ